MHRSIIWWLRATYRKHPPLVAALAQDDAPVDEIRAMMKRLAERWTVRVDGLAPDLASYFARSAAERSDAALKQILRKGGFTVRFQMGPAAKEVISATVAENVALIKSIAQRHLSEVEGLVMRSVAAGRDLHGLSEALQHQFGVTKRRAALISRDQNQKATAAINRVRQMELGIKTAVWLHSHAGVTPRPTHVAMNGKTYEIARGMWDSAEKRYVQPGELISCRCSAKPIIPGFS
jgi:SPP1 gp7 family putative phage head morphogenesis protein